MKTGFNKLFYVMFFVGCICLSNTTVITAQENIKVTLIKKVELSKGSNLTFFNFNEVQNPKPKIEVHDQKVIFYDAHGIEITVKQYTEPIYIVTSKNQKYLQIVRTTQVPVTKTAEGISVIELYSADGTLLWSKTRKIFWEDKLSKFIVSDQGNSIEVRVGGQLIFYDKTGNMINQHEIYRNLNLELMAFTAKFSDDGKYLLLGVNLPFQPTKSKEREKNTSTNRKRKRDFDNSDVNKNHAGSAEIILFDKTGTKQWQFISKHLSVGRMFFSPNNKYVLFSARDRKFENSTTYIIDSKSGEITSEHPGILAISVKFFNHNQTEYALINSVSRSVSIINLENGNLNRLYTTSGKEENILGTAVSSENGLIVFAKTKLLWTAHKGRKYPSYQESSLMFYDLTGNLLSQQSVSGEHLEALDTDNMDKMFFAEKSNNLIIYSSIQKSYQVYEIRFN